MKRTLHWLCIAALVALFGCSGGGPVGTGVSSIEGNISSVEVDSAILEGGAAQGPLPFRILVSIEELSDVETETDDAGAFRLEGEFSGPLVLRFSRPDRRPLASLSLDVPAGSTIVLEDIDLRPNQALPRTIRQRNFFGRIAFIDCDGGVLLIDDEGHARRQFLAQLSPDTTIHLRTDGPLIACEDLRRGDKVLVEGMVQHPMHGAMFIDAGNVIVRPRRNGPR